MTRRIALAILLTVWAMLIAGGLVAYLVTRSVLVADLDNTLVARGRARPEVSGRPEALPRVEESGEDRVFIDNRLGATQRVPQVLPDDDRKPQILSRSFIHLAGGRRYRSLTLRFSPTTTTPQPAVMVYSSPTDHLDQVLGRLAMALAVFGVAAGIAGAAAAVWISRRALRPLRQTAEVIGQIDDLHLDRRIDAGALPDEMRPVANRLNEMLERLQDAVAQRKQFLADASHELRTPVAALVTTLEVALRRPREAAEYARSLRTCLSDAKLLQSLVQTLLEHARSQAAPEMPQSFDAIAVLSQCADVAEGLAAGRDVQIVRSMPARLQITSYPNRLRGIVMNLLGNAVEHNRPGGTVELNCQIRGTALEISVADTGPGIAQEHIPHLFEPFYRASHDGDSESGRQHMGLGLFLVDSHVKSMGGKCRIESELSVGTTFHVLLPGGVLAEPVALEPSIV